MKHPVTGCLALWAQLGFMAPFLSLNFQVSVRGHYRYPKTICLQIAIENMLALHATTWSLIKNDHNRWKKIKSINKIKEIFDLKLQKPQTFITACESDENLMM